MARIVVVAPGRGTYNRSELNYLGRFANHPNYSKRQDLLSRADAMRKAKDRPLVSELDQATAYSPRTHLPGENASGLIFTCTAADFAMLDSQHEIAAVLGNSMGWYSTLYTGGALSFEDAFKVVDTMGYHQKGNVVGGQIIYPVVDESWQYAPEREAAMEETIAAIASRGEEFWVGLSIRLGGFRVLAGTAKGVKALLDELPGLRLGANDYPFQLARHGAFHTHLMQQASRHGFQELGGSQWLNPKVPMIDGRGYVWRPHATVFEELASYTLGHQVLEPYDFSASVRAALREYNPDHLVLLGPGETLGGAIAHVIISERWRGIDDKRAFQAAQKSETPPLIAMNRPDQAERVI